MKRSQPEGKLKKNPNRPERKKAATGSNTNNDSKPPAKKSRKQKEVIRTGKIGRFLSEKWPDELLVGNMTTVSTNDAVVANLDCIARFLADYRAVSALHAQNQQPTLQNNNENNNNNDRDSLQRHSDSSMAYYVPTVESFANTQIDRQSAGLRTNTTSQTTNGMAKVVDAHTQALQAAMDHVGPFQSTRFGGHETKKGHHGGNDDNDETLITDHLIPSKQTLSQWHGILYSYASPSGQKALQASKKGSDCKPPAVASARQAPPTSFRIGAARAGSTHFCPPREIEDEFQRFRRGMINICGQWEHFILLSIPERMTASTTTSTTSTSTTTRTTGSSTRTVNAANRDTSTLFPQQSSVYYSVAVAAMFLYGILDIHMFSDGNGRLARIGANWMLKRTLGIPFTIAIAANPQQRREYIEALQKGHVTVNEALQNLHKKQKDQTNAKQQALPKLGIFEPLIRLLLDRIASAVRECQRNLDEKSRASMVAEGDRLARIARERMASGACVICLDDNPNIATLCCGQGVHLNCIAEWLANNSTCVYCRKPFQSLQVQRQPPPPQRPAAAAAAAVVAPNAPASGPTRVLEELGRAATTIASAASIPAASQMNFRNQNLRSYLLGIQRTLQGIARGETGIQNPRQDAETTTENTTSFETTTEDTTSFETTTEDYDETETHDTTTNETTTNNDVDEDETSTNETTTLDNDETETTTYDTNTQDTTTNDVDEDETSTHDTTTHDTTADDTNTHDTSVDETTTNDSTNNETTTDDTSDDVTTSNVQHRSGRCNRCNNRAAIDCANDMCGRCCVLVGDYQCHRHGGA